MSSSGPFSSSRPYSPVVPSLAPAGRVVWVAVADVDLVPALATFDHVGVVSVLVGEDEVVAGPRDDLVGLAVADALEDLVVSGAVAGYALTLDELVYGERRGPHQGYQYHHQGKHHRQLAH